MKCVARVYPWLLLAPAILPLVVWSGVIYPFLVPKTLLFYATSLITLAVFLLLAAHGHPFYGARLRRPEMWIPAALLVLAYGASSVGVDFYRSFWSLFIRGDGLLMLTCVITNFYLIVISTDRTIFTRLVSIVAIVGSVAALYGVGEWGVSGGRIGGLLGNAAFFAGYLAISFFATLIAARGYTSSVWRSLAYTGAAIQILAIVLTATRGTLVALGIAIISVLIYRAWCGGKKRLWALGALTLLVGAASLFFVFRNELVHVPFAPVARLAAISTEDADVASRLFIWKHVIEDIKQHPWLGVGAEHISTLFNQFYDPTQIYEQWFDRSHNAFLDYAAQYGVGGLVLYLAVISLFFFGARRLTQQDVESMSYGPLFMLLAIVYSVQNFFVFDTISSFWLILALLAVLLAGTDTISEERPIVALVGMRAAAWSVAAALLLCVIPVSVSPALAAYDLAHAYVYQITDVPEEVRYLSRGFARNTYGDIEYGYQVYDIYSNQESFGLSGEAHTTAYTAARSILAANFAKYPYDARTALYYAHILSLAPEGVALDSEQLSSALERAIRLSEKRSQPWYILANLSIRQANAYPVSSPERAAGYKAAQDILYKYLTLVPTLSEPHFVLAELLKAAGNEKAAQEEAEKGKRYYNSGNTITARRAVGYYESVQDWNNAQFFLTEITMIDPADSNAWYDLAKVTYLAGDPSGALAIVSTLRKSNPDLLQTDRNFMAAIEVYEQSKK